MSWINSATAIARRVSTDVDFWPNHMRVAKPRIEPPTSFAVQIAASSGESPYRLNTHRGNNVHVPPKKTAKKILMIKR
jgi:hypothetical protein